MKNKCSTGDNRLLHPYIANYLEQFVGNEQTLARHGWQTWGNVKKKQEGHKEGRFWRVVSFDIIVKKV
jgi:hypothetical protein